MALPGYAGEIEARILLRRGDVAGAVRWADQARPEGPAGSPLLELLRRSMDTTIARVRLAQGRPDEARELLARTRAAQEASGAVADLISTGVLEARVADATGRRAEALRALERSVGLAAPGGYIRRFVDDGRSVAHLLPLVRTAAPAFVDVLIAAFADGADRSRRAAGARTGDIAAAVTPTGGCSRRSPRVSSTSCG